MCLRYLRSLRQRAKSFFSSFVYLHKAVCLRADREVECIGYLSESAKTMLEELQAKMLSIAEDFDSWLEEMAKKYNMPKDEIQALIRQFLQ